MKRMLLTDKRQSVHDYFNLQITKKTVHLLSVDYQYLNAFTSHVSQTILKYAVYHCVLVS